MISSVQIIASKKQGAIPSHEAAIGLIADRELDYLMSRGFTEEARAVLARGFTNIDIPLLAPIPIRRQVDYVLDLVAKYAIG